MFDKEKCIKNIYALSKLRNKNIGELEKEVEVSRGYLSRIVKESVSTNPSIDLLIDIAEKLNVSLDFLVNGDIAHLTPKEQYVYDFIHKLRKITENGKLDWIREEIKKYSKKSNTDITFYHTENTLSDYMFNSKYEPNMTLKSDIVYFAQLPDSEYKIMLLNAYYKKSLIFGGNNENTFEAVEIYTIEIDDYGRVDCNPICSSAYVTKEVENEINELNKCVFDARSRIGLNKSSKEAMNYLMNKLDDEGNKIEIDDGFINI